MNYRGTVLVARPRGGYKRISIKGFDKAGFRRGRKVLWGKRRRFWEPRPRVVEPPVEKPYTEYTYSGNTPGIKNMEFRVTTPGGRDEERAENKIFKTLDKTDFHGFRWRDKWVATGTRRVDKPIEGVKISMFRRGEVYFVDQGLVYRLVKGRKVLMP